MKRFSAEKMRKGKSSKKMLLKRLCLGSRGGTISPGAIQNTK
jgi:hypothetical protein